MQTTWKQDITKERWPKDRQKPSRASDVVVSEYRCKIATYDLFKEIKWECGSLYMDMRQVKND